VKKAVDTRNKMMPVIMDLTQAAAVTGEPIVKYMDYVFPGQGYETIINQFMLGDKYMVAPMLEKGNQRMIVFPKGKWKADDGSIIKGPVTKEVDVQLNRLPYFELIKK